MAQSPVKNGQSDGGSVQPVPPHENCIDASAWEAILSKSKSVAAREIGRRHLRQVTADDLALEAIESFFIAGLELKFTPVRANAWICGAVRNIAVEAVRKEIDGRQMNSSKRSKTPAANGRNINLIKKRSIDRRDLEGLTQIQKDTGQSVAAGLSRREIGRQDGVSHQAISGRLRRGRKTIIRVASAPQNRAPGICEIESKIFKSRPQVWREAYKLRRAGYSYREIGHNLGSNPNAARMVLRDVRSAWVGSQRN